MVEECQETSSGTYFRHSALNANWYILNFREVPNTSRRARDLRADFLELETSGTSPQNILMHYMQQGPRACYAKSRSRRDPVLLISCCHLHAQSFKNAVKGNLELTCNIALVVKIRTLLIFGLALSCLYLDVTFAYCTSRIHCTLCSRTW